MNDWQVKDEKLTKEFTFQGFTGAIQFINSVAEIANKHNHHPDIYLHSYKIVDITLFTHSAKAITEKDYALAREIDSLIQ